MNEKSNEQSYFQYSDQDGTTHEMGSFVEHFPIIHGPDTGIDAGMYYKKKDQEDSG
jgi:hypothetical protein